MRQDYSITLARIAAAIVADVVGFGNDYRVDYDASGNDICMTFPGYPLYNKLHKGDVMVQFPRSTFGMSGGKVTYQPLQQRECHYYQEKTGKAFAHSHVFNDGHPCWDMGKRTRAADFICNIIETFTLENVTPDSVMVGHCASSVMGMGNTAISNARSQRSRVEETLHSSALLHNRRQLENYVEKCWSRKITLLSKIV